MVSSQTLFASPIEVTEAWLKNLPHEQAKEIKNYLNKKWGRSTEDLIKLKLLTVEQHNNLTFYVDHLIKDNGIKGLVLGIFDPEKLIKLKDKLTANHFSHLVKDNAIIALLNEWIILEQAAAMPYPIHLKKLFSKESLGNLILENEFISPEEIAELKADELWRLDPFLTQNGFLALKNNLITFKETSHFKCAMDITAEIKNRLLTFSYRKQEQLGLH